MLQEIFASLQVLLNGNVNAFAILPLGVIFAMIVMVRNAYKN